jgi:hypothetical protein
MTAAPIDAPDDDKDWTWVLQRPCPDCGFDAGAVDRSAIGTQARAAMAALTARLGEPGATQRPSAEVWSPLEYACHVRDVCRVFGERVDLMLAEDDPRFANWNQDDTARAERYWEQDPATVAQECADAVDRIGRTFDGVLADQWERPGRRSNGSVFTVDTLGRYFLHDLVHHAHDVRG